MIESLEDALIRAQHLVRDPRQVRRIVVSGKRRSHTPLYTRIDIRPVEIKKVLHFQLVGHDGKRDITKNLSVEDFSLATLLDDGYGNLLIETLDEELNLRVTKSGQAQISVRKVAKSVEEAEEAQVELSHDRKKVRFIDESEPILQALGISDHHGKVKPSRSDKYVQVNEFLKVIDHVVKYIGTAPKVIDLGCGNAYLTFAAHQFMRRKGLKPHTYGVDSREESREHNLSIAREVKLDSEMEFVASSISEFPHKDVELSLALHACDTASDDAIAWAIESKSKVILIAPCCHHDIQKQIGSSSHKAPDSWAIAARHGILRERIGDILTDSIRAQVLRIFGYETDVIEFIASEHTPRNLMIRAIYKGRTATTADLEELDSIIQQWNIRPRLLDLLASPLSSQRRNASS